MLISVAVMDYILNVHYTAEKSFILFYSDNTCSKNISAQIIPGLLALYLSPFCSPLTSSGYQWLFHADTGTKKEPRTWKCFFSQFKRLPPTHIWGIIQQFSISMFVTNYPPPLVPFSIPISLAQIQINTFDIFGYYFING